MGERQMWASEACNEAPSRQNEEERSGTPWVTTQRICARVLHTRVQDEDAVLGDDALDILQVDDQRALAGQYRGRV